MITPDSCFYIFNNLDIFSLHRHGCLSRCKYRVCQTCSGNQSLNKCSGTSREDVGFTISKLNRNSAPFFCLILLCRPLRPAGTGWWLCTTTAGGRRRICPFSRATASCSPSTLMLSGAVAGSAAERACSPGLLLRAAQVWSSHSGALSISLCCCLHGRQWVCYRAAMRLESGVKCFISALVNSSHIFPSITQMLIGL